MPGECSLRDLQQLKQGDTDPQRHWGLDCHQLAGTRCRRLSACVGKKIHNLPKKKGMAYSLLAAHVCKKMQRLKTVK